MTYPGIYPRDERTIATTKATNAVQRPQCDIFDRKSDHIVKETRRSHRPTAALKATPDRAAARSPTEDSANQGKGTREMGGPRKQYQQQKIRPTEGGSKTPQLVIRDNNVMAR